MTQNTWGGRRVGAGSGGPRPGAGRPRTRLIIHTGDEYLMSRCTPDGYTPSEVLVVIGVTDDAIRFQSGDDIITLLRPK